MGSFRKGFAALLVFMALATAPALAVAAPASIHQNTTQIELKKDLHFSFISEARADDPAVSPSPAAPAAQSGMAKFAAMIADLMGKLPTSGVVITVLAFIYDGIRRKWPTLNPGGLLQDLSMLLKAFSSGFSKLAELVDSVLGQNIKQ